MRMYRRAKSWEETLNSRQLSHIHFSEDVTVELHGENPRIMPVQEFNDQFYKLLYSNKSFSYRINWIPVDVYDEEKVVELIENKAALSIYIGAKKRNKKRGGLHNDKPENVFPDDCRKTVYVH